MSQKHKTRLVQTAGVGATDGAGAFESRLLLNEEPDGDSAEEETSKL
jgi:hypothetical protein